MYSTSKEGCNRDSNRTCQCETVTVISILNTNINIVFTGNVQVEAGRKERAHLTGSRVGWKKILTLTLGK